MTIYSRVITRRQSINRFGKIGYVPYVEYFGIDEFPSVEDKEFIASMNKGKRILFMPSMDCEFHSKYPKARVMTINTRTLYDSRLNDVI